MLPQEGQREIDDAAFDLVSKASALAGQMNSIVTTAVGTVRCLTPTRTCRGSTGVWSTLEHALSLASGWRGRDRLRFG
jgi:hypothetical protein